MCVCGCGRHDLRQDLGYLQGSRKHPAERRVFQYREDNGVTTEAGYLDILGTPFVDKGRDPARGLDCWGLFMLIMRRFGLDVPDYGISSLDSEAIHFCFLGERGGPWRAAPCPARGMAVAMRLDPKMPQMVQHYGVCLDDRRFIHTLRKTGVLVTRINHRFFKDRIAGFYEWTG